MCVHACETQHLSQSPSLVGLWNPLKNISIDESLKTNKGKYFRNPKAYPARLSMGYVGVIYIYIKGK